ncbi:MAG: CHAD domain-containing protein [Leptolyngbya sp. DLM2.Bin27]|nr:MAG: CHAD domain-containing protein [Leptolyngbya sp. DLM2.Bin27]
MAYQFFTDDSVEANVQRILSEQLDKAIEQLSDNFSQSPEKAIHKARKHLKKGRSVLRLVRKSLGKKTYSRENACLRDVGRSLAPLRDGAVYPDTLTTLLETYGLTIENNGFADLQTSLVNRYQRQLTELCDRDQLIAPVIGNLKDSKARLSQIALKQSGWQALSKGWQNIYRQGQERFELAYAEGDDEAFHEWRKRVKDLWYDTCLLESLWPPIMGAYASEAHHLSELLGDDHDIAALRQFLSTPAEEVAIKAEHRLLLLPLMKHRQDKLHLQAQALGYKLYGERPKAFIHRLASYWQAEFQ